MTPRRAFALAVALGLGFLLGRVVGPPSDATGPASGAPPEAPRARLDRYLWGVARNPPPPTPSAAEHLAAIPYLQGYTPAHDAADVTIHDPRRVQPGHNFFTSAHAPAAFLMDMGGRVLHRWGIDFAQAFPGRAIAPENLGHDRFWRNALLLPGGEVLGIFEGLGLVKLDRESQLLWAVPIGAHHDVARTPDGTLYVLARERVTRKGFNHGSPILEDFVCVLAPDGKLLRRTSILEAFERSDHASLLDRVRGGADPFHTNSLRVLSGPALERSGLPARPGDVLISIRQLDSVAVLDLREARIVWTLDGLWRQQHDATLLESGRLLVFDNGGNGSNDRSRVVEVEPGSQRIVWSYSGGADTPFRSMALGAASRLANGNTLIVEAQNGRAIEVTPEGEIVWEYLNPFRAGEKRELVAALLSMTRIDAAAAAAVLN